MGVWIEIRIEIEYENSSRGVTPCVGVWIEIQVSVSRAYRVKSHSLRGSVD